MAVRRLATASPSPSLRGTELQTRSLTNSRMASATLAEAAMAATQERTTSPSPRPGPTW